MRDPKLLEEIAENFRSTSLSHRAIGSELYYQLTHRAIADPDILDLAGEVRAGQPYCYFLTCAVQFVLLAHPEEPLAAYFPSLTAAPKPPEDAYPAFREFCLRRRAQLADILATRTVQTTSVERCIGLLPAFDRVAKEAGEPLSLIEIGCSAGLLLSFDRYHYRWGASGAFGDPDAEVRIHATIIGKPPPIPARMPRIATRVGLDLAPVDAADPEEQRWIDGATYPEWAEERRNLRAALALRARTDLRVIAGDALVTLPPLLGEIQGPLCVFHSTCLYQWPEEPVHRLDALLREASRTRTLHRIGLEPRQDDRIAITPEMPPRSSNVYSDLVHTVYRDGQARATLLARIDGYGKWLSWLA